MLLFAALAAGYQNIASGDLGWHLALGRVIAETGRVPLADSLSYATGGRTFLDLEWLYQVLVYQGWRAGGPGLLIIVHSLLYGLAFYILARPGFVRGFSPRDLLLLLLAIVACEFRMTVRPHVLEVLFTCVLLDRLLACREGGRLYLPALLALQVVWCNAHGTFLAGVFFPILLLADQALLRQPLRRPAGLAAGMLAVSLINPQGVWIFQALLAQRHAALAGGGNAEWRPVSPDLLTLLDPGFLAFALLALCGSWFLLSRRAGRAPFPALTLALAVGLPFLHVRALPVSALALALLVSRLPQRIPRVVFEPEPWRLPARPIAALAGLALAAGLLTNVYQVWLGRGGRTGLGMSSLTPGWDAGRYLAQWTGIHRVFNSDSTGGWLAWWLLPFGGRVFIDTRDALYPPRIIREYAGILADPAQFERSLQQYRWDAVVLYHVSPASRLLLSYLAHAPGWLLVYLDDVSAVFLPARILAGEAFRTPGEALRLGQGRRAAPWPVAPEPGPMAAWSAALAQMGWIDDAAAGFAQSLDRDPRDARTLVNLGTYLLGRGQLEPAERKFSAALRADWLDGGAHQNEAAVCLRLGRLPDALRHGQWAARLKPRDPVVWDNLSRLYGISGDQPASARCRDRAEQLRIPVAAAL